MDICLLGYLKINKNFIDQIRSNLFLKIILSFVGFALSLIIFLVIYTFFESEKARDLRYETQDIRADFNNLYYLSRAVSRGGEPDDIVNDFILSDSTNWSILVIKNDSDLIIEHHENDFLNFSDEDIKDSLKNKFYSYSDFEYLAMELGYEGAALPGGIEEAVGGFWQIGDQDSTELSADFIKQIKNDSTQYRYFFISNEPLEPEVIFTFADLLRSVFWGAFAIIIFILIMYYYIWNRLKPIKLIKKRIDALKAGDLESKVEILGSDELAELTITFNKLTSEIKNLIDQKHRVLLDVSHELKTPLTRMRLMVEMLPESKSSTELKAEIGFLNELISNLLLSDKLDLPYSRLDIKETSLSDLINKAIATFNDYQKNKITFKEKNGDSVVFVDVTKMVVVIRNIVQNSFKYADTDEGVVIKLSKSSDGVVIKIRDFGPGIDSMEAEKIFEPFFRSGYTKKISGIGLGLSISKKIMKSHRGNIKLDLGPSSGVEFVLGLPKKKYDQ